MSDQGRSTLAHTLWLSLKGLVLMLAVIGLLTLVIVAGIVLMAPDLARQSINQLPPVINSHTDWSVDWQLTELNRQRLQIARADISMPDGTRLALEDATLTYSTSDLLDGQFQQLQIARLALTPGSASRDLAEVSARQRQQQVTSSLQQEVIELPDLQALMQLPVAEVSIDQFELNHPQADARFLVQLDEQRWRLSGSLTPHPLELPQPLQIELQLLHNGQLLGQISDRDSLLAHWYARIAQQPDHLQLTAEQILVMPALASTAERFIREAGLESWLDTLNQLDQTHTRITARLPRQLRWPDNVELATDTQLTTIDQQPLTLPEQLLDGSDLRAHLKATPLLQLQLGHRPAGSDSAGWHLDFRLPGITVEHLSTSPTASHQTGTAVSDPGDQPGNKPGNKSKEPATNVLAINLVPAVVQAQCNSAISQCQASTDAAISVDHQAPEQTASAELSLPLQLQWQEAQAPVLRTQPVVEWQAQLNDVPLQGSLTLELDALLQPVAELTLRQWQLELAPAIFDGWALDGLSLQQTHELTQHWDISGQQPRLMDSNALQLAAAPTRLQPTADLIQQQPLHSETRIRMGQTRLQCMPRPEWLGCQLMLQTKASRWQQWPIPAISLEHQISYQLVQQQLQGDSSLAVAGDRIAIDSHYQHNLADGIGNGQFHIRRGELAFTGLQLDELADLTGTRILAGDLSGQGWINWDLPQQRIEPSLMLRTDGLSLVYDNRITAESVSALLAMRPLPGPDEAAYEVTGQLSAGDINTGIRIRNAMARLTATSAADASWITADVEEMSLQVLGGRIFVPRVRYDSRQETNAFAIKVDALQLDHLTELEPSAEVEAEGALDGALPIIVDTRGPRIPQGTLFARAPGGVIRYQSDTSASLASSDPAVGLAMQALADFRFSELSSDVNYQPNGDLTLGLKFRGHNPDFFDGQSTHLNVTLDYNLLDLLQSLRVADDLIAEVESRYGVSP